MIATFPGFEPPIEQLFQLSDTPFDPISFRSVCETFAKLDPTSTDDDLWNFVLDSNVRLIVGVQVEVIGRKPSGRPEYRQVAVSCAILSTCWWDTYSRSAHDSEMSFRAERAEFDRLYDDALELTIRTLGSPRLRGADQDEQSYRHAIWRGKTGLLVLQQSAYDPQFGHDINYWVQPWSGSDPVPTSPFIDWLCKL
jgi:hypothetical protein